MAFTEPLEAAVVAVAQRAEPPGPKRSSLPSMLPPGCSAPDTVLATWLTARRLRAGLPTTSAWVQTDKAPTKMRLMAASRAQPWRRSFTICPKARQRAAGMRRMASIWVKFDRGELFSKGWAPLAPKKPPPLVPSILMAIWEAAGPMASTWPLLVWT